MLKKVKISVSHSAAALHQICNISQDYIGDSDATRAHRSTHIFIRALLEEKYALPYQALDTLVSHFLQFRAVPWTVIIHQSLLVFAQTYRCGITKDQREALLDLLVLKAHPTITSDIRRELLEGRKEEGRDTVPRDADHTML